MHIDIITLFPELLKSPFETSILKKAISSNKVNIFFHNLRNFSKKNQKQVDDYPFGGGAGMVLMIEPIHHCIESLKEKRNYDSIIYLSPDGDMLNQKKANHFSTHENIIIICGHYKGIDERIREHIITKEISIGDYVLSGGELAAAVLADSVIRLIPGVMNNESSALFDSFQDDLIAPPIYTRPENWNGNKVPYVLLSGNSKKIKEWNEEQSRKLTKKKIKIIK